jgi:hypothetical protein
MSRSSMSQCTKRSDVTRVQCYDMMKLLFDSTFLFRDTLEIAKQCASMSHNRLSFTQVHDGDFKSSSYVSQ